MVASDISTKSKFNHHHGVRLLSLDGGGVRGIVSLMVLDELMKRIQKRKGLSETPLPADYFELAAGTSTGGIIAIMLFRLRMSAEQAIEEYKIISQEVFKPKVYGFRVPGIFEGLVNKTKTIFQDSRFDSATLEKAIDSVVEKYGLDENDKKEKGKALLSHPKSSKISIVNDCMRKGKDQISINLAVKATSAAPTYFPEVVWKPHGSDNSLVFWDGGLLNNNPIDQLWYARHDVVEHDEPEPPISCVISLGTGYSRPGDPSSSWFRLTGVLSSVMALATNTNAKAKDFSRHMSDLKKRPAYKNTIYYRLNPHLKGNQIDLADYTKMDLLIELTNRYLQEKESAKYLELTVDAICPN
ncbi:hypothetical protein BGZ79_000981 [Entomortierella chlamydospora]|nr:hypothetical protein BGZ79_000981 [Entomortierella chlamydospora]